MKLSARNVLPGTVQSVTRGAVNAEIALALEGGEQVVAIITNASADALGLAPGKAAHAIIKASDVMIGVDVQNARLSARNVLSGSVAAIDDGAVNSEVRVRLSGGTTVAASITKTSVHTLGLHAGQTVSVLIKASHVMVGVDA